MNLAPLIEKSNALTTAPGVYLMKDEKEKIIYVGKAKNLKKRVGQYFKNYGKHLLKVDKMVEQVQDFSYIITDSEFEALVLECSLIKQYMPKYNILLKDDKGYHYIEITQEAYPRISAVMQKDGRKNSKFIGPYTSSHTVRQTVETVNTIFQLPTCHRVFPRDFKKERPCLNFYIKKCSGVCMGKFSPQEYGEVVKEALGFLRKSNREIVKELQEKMEQAAENLCFEQAAQFRDKIQAIQQMKEKQKVVLSEKVNQDVVGFATNQEQVAICVMEYRKGLLRDKKEFLYEETQGLKSQWLSMYYLREKDRPDRVLLDEDFEDRLLLEQGLQQGYGEKIEFVFPQKGENKNHVMLAVKNAADKLSGVKKNGKKEEKILQELEELLKLPRFPKRIECYDISNLGKDDMVGGMIVFLEGKSYSGGYRKFKIKTLEGQDDYSAMREVLTRRFQRYRAQEIGSGFAELPDLIFLDGGQGHLSVGKPYWMNLG